MPTHHEIYMRRLEIRNRKINQEKEKINCLLMKLDIYNKIDEQLRQVFVETDNGAQYLFSITIKQELSLQEQNCIFEILKERYNGFRIQITCVNKDPYNINFYC